MSTEDRLQVLAEAHVLRLRERDQLEMALRGLLQAVASHQPPGSLHEGLDPGRCPLCLAIAAGELALKMLEPRSSPVQREVGRTD